MKNRDIPVLEKLARGKKFLPEKLDPRDREILKALQEAGAEMIVKRLSDERVRPKDFCQRVFSRLSLANVHLQGEERYLLKKLIGDSVSSSADPKSKDTKPNWVGKVAKFIGLAQTMSTGLAFAEPLQDVSDFPIRNSSHVEAPASATPAPFNRFGPFRVDTSGVNFSKEYGDTKFSGNLGTNLAPQANENKKTNISPGFKRGSLNMDKGEDLRVGVSLEGGTDGVNIGAFLSVLHGRLGTRISAKEGSNLKHFLLSEGLKLDDNDEIVLTLAVLKKVEKVIFSEINQTRDPEMTQKGVGINYTHFNPDKFALIQELGVAASILKTGSQEFGRMTSIVSDDGQIFDQFGFYGGVAGGYQVSADLNGALRFEEQWRLDVAPGAEHTRYDGMYETSAEQRTRITASAKLTYQPDAWNQFELGAKHSSNGNILSAGYKRSIGDGVEAFLRGEYIDRNDGLESENKALVGLTWTLNGKSGLAPLFSDRKKSEKSERLTHAALAALVLKGKIASERLEVPPKKITWTPHEVRINQNVLPGASSLEKNPDGSLKALRLDTGANNLVSVSSVNYPEHASYFSILESRFLKITNFEKLHAPAEYRVSILDTNGLYTIISFTTIAGSVNLNVAPGESVHGLSQAVAAAYVAGTMSIAQAIESLNDTPTGINLSASTVAENTANNTDVATLTATDPDAGDTHTFSLVSQTVAGAFKVVGDKLQVNDSTKLDFETNQSINVTIRVTDAGGKTYETTKTINISNVVSENAPTAITLSNNTIVENTANNTDVATLTATDVDAGDTFTFSLVDQSVAGAFKITGDKLQVNDSTKLDFEANQTINVTIRVTDSGGFTRDEVKTINLTNIVSENAPTAINLSASAINENTANNTNVATLTATDVDAGDTHTFSLVSQTVAGAFKISGDKLQVNDSSKLDFETNQTINVTIRVTDSGGFTRDETKTINISDVNEDVNDAPTGINLSTSTVAENTANNTDVATLTATDPDAGDTHTFSLVDQSVAGAFKISGNKLQVNDSTKLDFETNATINVTIRVTDSGGLTRDEVKTINISDVNEDAAAPSIDNFNVGGRVIVELTAGEYLEATVSDASGLSAAWDDANNYTVTVDDGFGGSFILDSSKYSAARVAADRVRFTITDPTAIPFNYAGGTVDVRSNAGVLTDASPSANAVAGNTRIFFTGIIN